MREIWQRPPAPREAAVEDDDGTLMEISDLHVRFAGLQGVARVVCGVSMRVERGQVVAVIGESGSGKTILTRTMMGLVTSGDKVEVSGSVRYRGIDLLSLPAAQLREYWGSELSMILQDPMTSLNPVRRIGVQLTESIRRRNPGLSRADARLRAIELIDAVGLSDPERRVRQYPHELSGGMRQRITIAIAVAGSPQLMFADEPTTALDVTVQEQIFDLLFDLQREHHMALVLVTHDLTVVRRRSGHVVVMYAGRVVETGPTAQVLESPRMPYTESLLHSIPPITGPNHVRLRVIPGRPPSPVDPPSGCRFSPRCPYAQTRCLMEEPPMLTSPDSPRSYRCWFPVGSAEWEHARQTNFDSGRTGYGRVLVQGELDA